MVAIDHTSQGNRATLRWLLYDGHGNLVRTMAPDYALSAWQFRGVWGEVQDNLNLGRGYCANLGHPEDETGLVYMRARYYEPATGWFISEDPAQDGVNWYLYADGNPVNKVDPDGKMPAVVISLLVVIIEGLIAALVDIGIQLVFTGGDFSRINWAQVGVAAALGILGGAVGHFFRAAHYMKTAIGRHHWVDDAPSFKIYFAKFIGRGTETSLIKNRWIPVVRSLLLGGGSGLFMEMYGGWLMHHAE